MSEEITKDFKRIAPKRWKRYPRYKDSGVEWIGEIPEGWDVARLKRVVSHVGRGISPNYAEKSSIAVINQACIYWEGISEDDLKYHEETDISELRKGLLKKGDLLLNSTGTGTLGRALLFNLDRVCIADSHVTIVRCNRKLMIPSFLRLLVETPLYQSKILNELVAGSTNQIELSREELRNLIIPLPADEEQQWIVRGITEKTVEIDALISKKQLLIELLKEKRAAIISRAVTKGLDPNAPMKDSGVEWIGEIPEGWDLIKVKYLSEIKSGEFLPSEEISGLFKYPVIGGNGVLGYSDQTNSHGECVVIGRVGAKCGNIHLVKEQAWITDNALILKPSCTVSIGYLAYSLDSLHLNQFSSQNAQPLITGTQVKEALIAIPSLGEQIDIASSLEKVTEKIDFFISKIEKSIELLKEYRSALITAAVTGKIDVREEVP